MAETHLNLTRRNAILAVAAAMSAAAARADDRPAGSLEAQLTGDVHDFDYHIGDWTLVNRRLKKRWTKNPEWDEFSGTDRYVQYLGGIANVDEVVFPTKGFSGLTVRTFDLERKLWAVYWINSRNGVMGTPMFGGFRGNHGLFYGDDTDDGRPIKARYLREKLPPDREHWEQAFSLDGGTTWETNWTADFTRVRS